MSNQEQNDRIVHIVEANMLRLESEIAKLNRRADKIGCPHLEIVIHGTELKKDPTALAALREYYVSAGLPVPSYELECIPLVRISEVEIVGEGPKIEGYKFIGTLDHYTLPGQVLVNTVPGETVPAQFFAAPAICDHCNKIRSRVETFIVEKEDDGSYVQVGRNCLRDFFGHDPMSVARWLNRVMHFITSLEDDGWTSGGGTGRYTTYYNSLTLLKTTVAMIRTYGWIAKSSAREDQTPTAANVTYVIKPPYSSNERRIWEEFKATVLFDEAKDTAEAEAAVAWLKTQDGNNEYMHNLKLLENEEAVPGKMVGYWCSLIAAYQRDQDRLEYAKREEQLRLNDHLGTIGQRIEARVTCTGVQSIDSEYGVVNIHRMRDSEGRNLVWFANAARKMEKDNEYVIRAGIKSHGEYKDWAQTILTRVVVVEELVKEDREN